MRGKGKFCYTKSTGKQDHPRLCGEKAFPIPQHRSGAGSPPPMRGKGSDEVTLTVPARITPAYAGKSTQLQFHYAIIRDHPRLCGEKDIVHAVSKCNIGSPPPMRGKVFFRCCGRYSRQDHPRLCGEKLVSLLH